MPSPACVAATLVETSARFERYADAIIENGMGDERLRLVDASRLVDANIRDWDDLKRVSAHIRNVYNTAEEARNKELEAQQAATAAAAALEEEAMMLARIASCSRMDVAPSHHSRSRYEYTVWTPEAVRAELALVEEDNRRARALAASRRDAE